MKDEIIKKSKTCAARKIIYLSAYVFKITAHF